LVESDPTAEYIVTLLSTTDLPNQPSLKARGLAWRLLSASEVLLGAAIVIGHNVFRVVPNEVPILFVLGLVSVRIRDGGWAGSEECRVNGRSDTARYLLSGNFKF
jgi:hypothetical protein